MDQGLTGGCSQSSLKAVRVLPRQSEETTACHKAQVQGKHGGEGAEAVVLGRGAQPRSELRLRMQAGPHQAASHPEKEWGFVSVPQWGPRGWLCRWAAEDRRRGHRAPCPFPMASVSLQQQLASSQAPTQPGRNWAAC